MKPSHVLTKRCCSISRFRNFGIARHYPSVGEGGTTLRLGLHRRTPVWQFSTDAGHANTNTTNQGTSIETLTSLHSQSQPFQTEDWVRVLQSFRAIVVGGANRAKHGRPSLSKDELAAAFGALDLLCRTSAEGENVSAPIQIEQHLLENLLDAWESYTREEHPIGPSVGRDDTSIVAQAFKDRLNDADVLNPTFVLKLLKRLFASSIAPPLSSAHFDVALSAMTKRTANPFHGGETDEGPHEADRVFRFMAEQGAGSKLDVDSIHPTNRTVYQVIQIWANSKRREALARAEAYLQQLKDWYDETGNHNLFAPSAPIYCSVMEAHSRNVTAKSFDRIQSLVSEMEEKCASWQLDIKAYTRVCHALAQCRHPESADAARSILDRMLLEADLKRNSDDYLLWTPDPPMLLAVLSAYGIAGRVDDAAELVTRMENLASESESYRPNAMCYNALVWAHAKEGNAEAAEDLMPRLVEALEREGSDELLDYEVAMSGVLTSWAQSGDPQAIQRVAVILRQLEEHHRDGETSHFATLTASTYNALLTCYAQQPREHATQARQLAVDLFGWMEEQENPATRPNSWSYLNVLLACRNDKRPELCQHYLEKLISKARWEQQDASLQLMPQHFNVTIAAWSDASAPSEAHHALQVMKRVNVAPDRFSYNTVLTAFARKSDTADVIGNLIEEMKAAQITPDQHSFNAVLLQLGITGRGRRAKGRQEQRAVVTNEEALRRAMDVGTRMRELGIQPNATNYNTLMQAWFSRGLPEQAEEAFQEYLNQARQDDRSEERKLHVTRLQAWASAGDPEKTVQALEDLIKFASEVEDSNSSWWDVDRVALHPPAMRVDTRDSNAVLQAWLRSGRPDAAQQAHKWLNDTMKLERRFESQPDIFSYTLVMSTYNVQSKKSLGRKDSYQDAAEKVWGLFCELEDAGFPTQEGEVGDERSRAPLLPGAATYSAVLIALLRAGTTTTLEQARFVLQKMEMGGVSLSCYPNHEVLQAWSSLRERPPALERLFRMVVHTLSNP